MSPAPTDTAGLERDAQREAAREVGEECACWHAPDRVTRGIPPDLRVVSRACPETGTYTTVATAGRRRSGDVRPGWSPGWARIVSTTREWWVRPGRSEIIVCRSFDSS